MDFEETIGCVRALRALGRDGTKDNVEVMVVPDETHGLTTYAHQLQAYVRMATFFFEHLDTPAAGR